MSAVLHGCKIPASAFKTGQPYLVTSPDPGGSSYGSLARRCGRSIERVLRVAAVSFGRRVSLRRGLLRGTRDRGCPRRHQHHDHAELRREILAVLALPLRGVVVDLGYVTFMDSSGVAALIAAFDHARERGIELPVTAVPRCVRLELEIARPRGTVRSHDTLTKVVTLITRHTSATPPAALVECARAGDGERAGPVRVPVLRGRVRAGHSGMLFEVEGRSDLVPLQTLHEDASRRKLSTDVQHRFKSPIRAPYPARGPLRGGTSQSVWGTEGPGFESRQPDHETCRSAHHERVIGSTVSPPQPRNRWGTPEAGAIPDRSIAGKA